MQTQVVTSQIVDWLGGFEEILEKSCSELTVKAYKQDVLTLARWFEGEYEMPFSPDQLTRVDLKNFRDHCLKELKQSATTWNRKRIAFRRFCAWCVDQGFINDDVSDELKAKEVEEVPIRWLDKADLHRFLRQVERGVNTASTEDWKFQALRDQAMVGLMLYVGLREFEVAALNWEDIELGERKGKITIRDGKGNKQADLPLSIEARRVMEKWREVSKSWGSVFTGKGTGRISTRTIQRRVKAIGIAAGIHLSPHDLRHTFAKRLVDGEVPITTVQKLLRHARLETTARYVKPGWGDLEEAVERI